MTAHTNTHWHSHAPKHFIIYPHSNIPTRVTSLWQPKPVRGGERRILQGTQFARSANTPTDAAAGWAVRNISQAYPCVTENEKLDPARTKQGSHRSDAFPLKHVVLFPGSSTEGSASTLHTSPEFSWVHPTPPERVVDKHGGMKAGKGSRPCCSFQSIDSNTGTRRKTSTRWIPNLLDPSSPSELPSPCFYTFPLED